MPPTHIRPDVSLPREYTFPRVDRATLSNGVRVIVAPVVRLPIVTMLALVDAGAVRDATGAEGVALLTARALVEGRAGSGDPSLSEAFEALGTGFDATSDWDAITANITVTAERGAPAMRLLAHALMHPEFSERDVVRLREERTDELLQLALEPRGLADETFAAAVYADASRYSLPEGGTRTSVERVGVPEVRAHYNHTFAPDTTSVIVVGQVTAAEAITLAEQSFGSWRGTAQMASSVDDRVRRDDGRVIVVDKIGAPQTELRVGHCGVARGHQDYFPLVVMNALLGGLFSSRINLNLRERNGFTYGARSALEWRRGKGPFVVSTAVKTDATASATREILAEIDRIRVELVDAEELSLATAYLDGVFPIRFETTAAVADAIARAETYRLGDEYYSEYRARVRAVTAADVRRVAQEHLRPADLRIVAVGNAESILPELEKLEIGPVRTHQPERQS